MSKRILFIPGLAANANLFNQLIKSIPGEVPMWPEHDPEDTLVTFSSKCIEKWQVTPSDILIGFSFGGMIAKEIRQSVPSQNASSLFLISSCKDKFALDKKFIKRSKLLAYVPNFLLYFMAIYLGPLFTARTSEEREFKPLLKSMAKTTSISFLKWATRASGEWQNESKIDMVQIHGENDDVIPSPKNDPTHIIKNASHLICYTHSLEIAKIFKDYHNE
jgi:hypothetical protein